jgi:hypothetical protein
MSAMLFTFFYFSGTFVLMFDMLVCLPLQYELLQTDSVKALKGELKWTRAGACNDSNYAM